VEAPQTDTAEGECDPGEQIRAQQRGGWVQQAGDAGDLPADGRVAFAGRHGEAGHRAECAQRGPAGGIHVRHGQIEQGGERPGVVDGGRHGPVPAPRQVVVTAGEYRAQSQRLQGRDRHTLAEGRTEAADGVPEHQQSRREPVESFIAAALIGGISIGRDPGEGFGVEQRRP
jgi:hypothetical protein